MGSCTLSSPLPRLDLFRMPAATSPSRVAQFLPSQLKCSVEGWAFSRLKIVPFSACLSLWPMGAISTSLPDSQSTCYIASDKISQPRPVISSLVTTGLTSPLSQLSGNGKNGESRCLFPCPTCHTSSPTLVTWCVPFMPAYKGGVQLILSSAFICPIFMEFNSETFSNTRARHGVC